jgi:hypothetical protein
MQDRSSVLGGPERNGAPIYQCSICMLSVINMYVNGEALTTDQLQCNLPNRITIQNLQGWTGCTSMIRKC